MGLFTKKGKHSPGNQPKRDASEHTAANAEATQALGGDGATRSLGGGGATQTLGDGDATQALGGDSATQALGDAATRAMPAAAGQPDQTSAMPAAAASGKEAAAAATGLTGRTAVMAAADDALAGFDRDAAGYPLNAAAADAGSFKAADFADVPKKKRRRAFKAAAIVIGVLVVLVAGAYVAGGVAFGSRFLPNTTVQGIDVSMKTDDEVAQLLDGVAQGYQLDVVGNNFSYRTTGPDLGLSIDSAGVVKSMHARLSSWEWPLLLLEGAHDESDLVVAAFDEEACAAGVATAIEEFNKNAEAPKDASVVFDEAFKMFRVEPEQIGTQLDAEAVGAVVKQAVASLEPKAEVTDGQLLQPKRLSTDEKLIESAEMATGMISANISLNINGETKDVIDGDTLSQFVSVTKKLKVKFDEDGLAEWVGNLAASYDTVGMSRTYTRADGKTVTVSGGTYGWEIDKESLKDQIMAAIKAGGTSEIEIPCVDTANVYAGAGERDWGNRYIDVDISEQHVRFYGDDGKIIWESDCISGAPDGKHDTVQGVWYVIMKQSPSKLIGYKADGKTKEYETEVKYWMPFEGNSIGFHDAPWQPSFGGSMYSQGYGSHGCVNLPSDKAKELYKIIEPNDVVVVHS